MNQTSEVGWSVDEFRQRLQDCSVNFPGLGREYLILPKEHNVEAHWWRWSDLEDLLVKSAEFQDELPQGREGAERRIIRLQNPGLPDETVTNTMSVSLQYLLPGEVARTHRHTPNAFRFFLRGEAYTTVSGEKCVMHPGDLVITPFLEWHDHGNESDEPAVWMDGLDYPLVRYLDSIIYEYAPEQRQEIDERSLSGRRHGYPGLKPAWVDPQDVRRRSLLHYRAEHTFAALNTLAEAGDADPFDDVILEYVNPVTGGSVFPTIACCMQMIRPNVRTKAHRHTGSAVYHVFKGSGETVVGDEVFSWTEGDLFVVPPLAPHQHANDSGEPAILFSIQDYPALKALGLFRTEPA